jgi:hypothetical protein
MGVWHSWKFFIILLKGENLMVLNVHLAEGFLLDSFILVCYDQWKANLYGSRLRGKPVILE